MHWFRSYRLLVAAAFRAEFQYRGNILISILGGLCYQGVGLAFLWAVLERFGTIGGWGLDELAFLYGMRLVAHSLWATPGNQLVYVDEVIVGGEYDRYLVRPAPPLVQLLARRLRLTAFGDLIGGVTLLSLASARAPVDWSPAAVGYLVLAVIGGALVEGALQLAACALAFRMKKTMSIRLTIDSIFNDFGNYPLKVFGAVAGFGLTFIFPLAFVAYLPTTMLLNRAQELAVPIWLGWGAPAMGVLLMYAAYRFWVRQSQFYESSGH
ncbi:ABC transporter permease [Pseudonocardia sp. HH130630-07]|uniref:ABC transporter permease n=1 Tax=Pseudonocardia sp. HH130630-07 TaxID=1690815 RepID=UPI000814F0FB|nr:ABC-2 family transporter protein [Pseudonocardia sp. HH130630-07]ANY05776.1 ABC transporter permease [Pseudonocardia sp. HH130630-07]